MPNKSEQQYLTSGSLKYHGDIKGFVSTGAIKSAPAPASTPVTNSYHKDQYPKNRFVTPAEGSHLLHEGRGNPRQAGSATPLLMPITLPKMRTPTSAAVWTNKIASKISPLMSTSSTSSFGSIGDDASESSPHSTRSARYSTPRRQTAASSARKCSSSSGKHPKSPSRSEEATPKRSRSERYSHRNSVWEKTFNETTVKYRDTVTRFAIEFIGMSDLNRF